MCPILIKELYIFERFILYKKFKIIMNFHFEEEDDEELKKILELSKKEEQERQKKKTLSLDEVFF